MPSVGVHVYRSCRLVSGNLAVDIIPEGADSKLKGRMSKRPAAITIPKDYGSVDMDVSLADSGLALFLCGKYSL